MGLLAGLTAALAWTLASSLWRGLSTSLKAPQLNGLKNAIACLVLLPVLVAVPWVALPQVWTWLLVSGAVGIAAVALLSCVPPFFCCSLLVNENDGTAQLMSSGDITFVCGMTAAVLIAGLAYAWADYKASTKSQ